MYEKEAMQWVYSQVADEIGEMYEKYRKKSNLEEENETERQLEILASKKYISKTFMSNLSLITDYYVRGMENMYRPALEDYKIRIKVLTESI